MEQPRLINEIIRSICQQIEGVYSNQEARQVAFLLLEHLLHISKSQQLLNTPVLVTKEQSESIDKHVQRLKRAEPIQYILEKAAFFGREFKVCPGVLVPRPETEELVHWVISDTKSEKKRILDIGTGSGCIAITLALELPKSEVYGLDISPLALSIAQENVQRLNTSVTFLELDFLKKIPALSPLDVIVSNPPYVPLSDLQDIESRVADYEPSLALFVPNANPLLFYKRIAQTTLDLLKPGGTLYLEIYHTHGPEVLKLFQQLPWSQAQLKKDLHNKDRLIKVIRN